MSAGRRSQLCAGQQGAGRHGLAEAAGRAEQRDAPAGHGVRSASDSLISITGPFVISAPSLSLWYCKVLQSYFSLKPYIFKAFITFANKKAMTPFFVYNVITTKTKYER